MSSLLYPGQSAISLPALLVKLCLSWIVVGHLKSLHIGIGVIVDLKYGKPDCVLKAAIVAADLASRTSNVGQQNKGQ
jgi:hypothetical protein